MFNGKVEMPPELENTALYYRWYSSSFSGLSSDGKKVLFYSMHKEALTNIETPYRHTLGFGSHIITLAASDQPGESKKDLKKIKHGGVTGGAQGEHPCIIHILKAKIISPKEGSILPRSGFTLRAEAPVAWLNEHYRCLCYRWRLVPVGEPIDRPSFDSNKMAFAFFEEGQPRTVSYRFDPKLLKDAIGGYQLILIVTADRVSDADEESDTKSHEDRKMVILEMA